MLQMESLRHIFLCHKKYSHNQEPVSYIDIRGKGAAVTGLGPYYISEAVYDRKRTGVKALSQGAENGFRTDGAGF